MCTVVKFGHDFDGWNYPILDIGGHGEGSIQ